MFTVGDTVVHPNYGAGVITDIRELQFLGNEKKRYYSINLLTQSETVVMVAVRNAEKVGLRPPIPRSKLNQVWSILRSDPQALPVDHNMRYAALKDKLRGGDVFRIAEALRDMAWRKEQRKGLTTEGARLYEHSMNFLSAEIAIAQGSDFADAETQISRTLTDSIDAN